MLYNVARLALHVMKAETRSADYINIQDGGPQEHQYRARMQDAPEEIETN